ncbi:HNH endonuclease [Rhodanobacter sp. C01]|uniref:HNH endonuclease n=1 Tax=Rhodanobacter sp. C01 TaxID=1945856 RepID=UPI00098496A2|nr:HNH endonuclease [Rhodanobacter sp. C01]OOG51254.1 hypothetical protein B0E50_00565 [Rhodanobacter sp. C01]
MTTFMLMRVNYDSRDELRPQERYSKQVTKKLNAWFVERYKGYRDGGDGFHEGLNFAECADSRVRIYIPPKPPSEGRIDDDFVIFTFTYASETEEGRNRIIGMHAGVTIHRRDYKSPRPDHDGRFERISYQASAPANLCTLFLTPSGKPLPRKEGRHISPNYRWGTGHRYFDVGDRAKIRLLHNILTDARKAAEDSATSGLSAGARRYAAREITVIDRVLRLHFSAQVTKRDSDDINELFGKGRATTRKQLIEARLGQGSFRRGLEERWDCACALTGCDLRQVLRASHMKPWSKSKQSERLDPRNGLLLEANIDALFDGYLISFADNGSMLLSNRLTAQHRKSLGLNIRQLRKPLEHKELSFLHHHRKEFDKQNRN